MSKAEIGEMAVYSVIHRNTVDYRHVTVRTCIGAIEQLQLSAEVRLQACSLQKDIAVPPVSFYVAVLSAAAFSHRCMHIYVHNIYYAF